MHVYKDATEAATFYGAAVANTYCNLAGGACPVYDHEQELAGEKDLSYESAVDVGGGSENTRYYFSGLAKKDAGIIGGTGFWKQSPRAHLDQRLSSRLGVSLNTNFVQTLPRPGLTNNHNAFTSHYMSLRFPPSLLHLRPD